ncbi:MAG TPA: hypothetical protein VFN11_20975 [Ktedonobacterales bacterium]|nr:hypothetical protein [Ktedonobacterales bacterium]
MDTDNMVYVVDDMVASAPVRRREAERTTMMRQRSDARQTPTNKSNMGSSWFRVGVISATALAPLIARWNDLRTSNRAQTLREIAAARLSDAMDARDQAAVRLAPVRAAANAKLGDALTVANAKLGDARELASARIDDARVLANAKLDDARELANAQLDNAIDRLAQVRTPERLRNVLPFSLAVKRAQELERQRQRRRRTTTLWWLAGVGIGLAAAGTTAYVIARRRMASPIEDDEPMVELPTERNLAEATVGTAPSMRTSYAAAAERAEMSVPVQTFASAGTVAPDQARYIGNVRTMIFHDAADSSRLPSEENRIYFASEAEARQAGFRLAREPEGTTETDHQ